MCVCDACPRGDMQGVNSSLWGWKIKCWMSCLLSVVILSVSVLNISNALVGKKIKRAIDDEFPFVVSIGWKVANGKIGHYHYCTGALISEQHVLTAEHCVEDTKPDEIQVSVGSSDTQNGRRYDVDRVESFESWSKAHNKPIKFDDNDVAVLQLKEPLEDPKACPAVVTYKKIFELYGKDAVTAGWGVSNTGRIPRYMEKAQLHVTNYSDCMRHVKNIVDYRVIIPENYLCTLTNADALIQSGDSGAPLLIGDEIIAINGATFPSYKDDNDPDVQNMHVLLYHYKEFIEDMLLRSNARLHCVRSPGN